MVERVDHVYDESVNLCLVLFADVKVPCSQDLPKLDAGLSQRSVDGTRGCGRRYLAGHQAALVLTYSFDSGVCAKLAAIVGELHMQKEAFQAWSK
jgi:hypothetical protein